MSETMKVYLFERRNGTIFVLPIISRIDYVTRNNVRHEITIMIYVILSSSCIITVAARVITLHHITVIAAHRLP